MYVYMSTRCIEIIVSRPPKSPWRAPIGRTLPNHAIHLQLYIYIIPPWLYLFSCPSLVLPSHPSVIYSLHVSSFPCSRFFPFLLLFPLTTPSDPSCAFSPFLLINISLLFASPSHNPLSTFFKVSSFFPLFHLTLILRGFCFFYSLVDFLVICYLLFYSLLHSFDNSL